LSGAQDVWIPSSNIECFVLHPDVMQAIEGRLFHVCSISGYECIELLTGILADSMDEKDFFHRHLESCIREKAKAFETEKPNRVNVSCD
jgi:hypothetical protein